MSDNGALREATWASSIQRGLLLSLCEAGKFSVHLVAQAKATYKENSDAFIKGGIIIGGVSLWSLYLRYRSNRRLVRDTKIGDINESISNDSLDGMDITRHYRGYSTQVWRILQHLHGAHRVINCPSIFRMCMTLRMKTAH